MLGEMGIVERFYSALMREEVKPLEPLGDKVWLTHLAFDCARRSILETTYLKGIRPRSIIRSWIGRKLHELNVLGKEMEITLEYDGVVGRIDEYDPENKILLEKKTTTFTPREITPITFRQAEYEKWLLEKNGREVRKCFVLYIDFVNDTVRAFEVNPRDSQTIGNEIRERKSRILDARKWGILPPRTPFYLDSRGQLLSCSVCPTFHLCYLGEEAVPPGLVYLEEEEI
jgi:hypothetical protein